MTTATTIEGLQTEVRVGLEVHVELATRTKMWSGAPNPAHPDNYDAEPNTLVDPVVLGMPGVLPVLNREALAMAVRIGLALGCRIASYTKWDRKSYSYPDLPKNYQISQYDLPVCEAGAIDVPVDEEPDAELQTVRIRRAHLEEDAGKLLHEAPGGRPIDQSIVDLNRAGTPLLEIVTEPDIVSAEQAVLFGQTLRNICRFLGVSDGIMQRGQMRFEPNVNVVVEKDGERYATPIVEVKNLNSFRALRGVVDHEHGRQTRQWLADGVTHAPGSKTTRGWDDERGVTLLQREKEEAHDYRYFPDPDIVPVRVDEAWLEELRGSIPELPVARERRYRRDHGLGSREARHLAGEPRLCAFYEGVVEMGGDPVRTATVLLNNLAKLANERGCEVADLLVTPGQLREVERMRDEQRVSSNGADQLYRLCAERGSDADPAQLAEAEGLLQVSDSSALDGWIAEAIEREAQAAEDVRNGKEAAIGRLVGAVMKASKGQANPRVVQQKLREKLLQ